MTISDNEIWICDFTHEILLCKAAGTPLADWENLVECVWILDTSVRNAGSYGLLEDLDHTTLDRGVKLASQFALSLTARLFALSEEEVCDRYHQELFEPVCDEIRPWAESLEAARSTATK